MNTYEPMWAKYYAPKLSAREINQFRRAEMRCPSLLLTDVIQTESFDPKTRRYMAVANRKEVRGRNHFLRAELGEGRAEWELQCLFTNALQMSFPWEDDFSHPSARVEIARHHIITIEFDSMSLPFFKQQLSWFRFEKKPTDSPIGKFLRHLRGKYADVAGLNVTYSGNKSFHYHFVVETALIAGAVSEPPSARLGFQKAWDRLRDEFITSTDLMVPSTERPDESLRNPENFRRLPNGMRLNDKEDHFFGVPVGDVLIQVVMWEHLTLQRSRGGSQTLLVPADFSMAASTSATAPRTGGTQVQTSVQPGEEAYCAAKLEAIFNGVEAWPKFAGFDRSQGALRAQFFNSPGDRHPASMMRSDFATVLVQGANPDGLTNVDDAGGTLMPRLPRPLGEMMELWSEEHRQRQLGPGGRVRAPVEQQFADSATTKVAATSALGEVINDLIPSKINRPGVDLLCAPEGISKSGTLLVKGRDKRPAFDALLKGVARRDFDQIACFSVCRIGRSLPDLIHFLGDIQAKGVDLYVHTQGLDTSTPSGAMMFQMLSVFSSYERAILRERILSGLRRTTKKSGRKPMPDDRVEAIRKSLRDGLGIRATARLHRASTTSVTTIKRSMQSVPA